MKRRHALPAGILDAGLASFATFVVGLYAVTTLQPGPLGIYSLYFAAFMVATVFPAQLVFVPIEVAAVSTRSGESPMSSLRQSLKCGTPIAVLAGMTVCATALVVPPDVAAGSVAPFTVTAVASAVLSPVQDHVRRLLHIAGASWRAAGTSAIQLIGVSGAIALFVSAGIPVAWRPFGALAIANGASLAAALFFSSSLWRALSNPPTLRELLSSGRWLLLAGLLPSGSGFVAASFIAWLAAPEALGHAEAARVVGQPVLVLSMGLAAVLGPKSMDAGAQCNVMKARRIRRHFLLALLAGGVAYAALVGHSWWANPVALLVPTAYAVPGLVGLTLLANIANGLAFPQRYELMGAGRVRTLTVAEGIAATGQCLIAATAGFTGAFAKPLGLTVMGGMRLVWFSGATTRLY